MMKKTLLLGGVALVALGAYGANKLGVFGVEENIRKVKNAPIIQAFEEIDLDFTHVAHKERFPFTGGTVLDIDGNGTMEIFLSGSKGQPNGIFAYRDGKLVNITEQTGLTTDEAAFGATSFDMDNDGDTDLIIAQQNGVWIYSNNGGRFSGKKVNMKAPAESFPVNVAIADINKDGEPDLYVSNFVVPSKFVAATFNDPDHAKTNIMLLNQGNGNFRDVTAQTGTAGIQNTFHSAFIDLNGNGHQDLILANNTGPVQIFRNKGNLNFEPYDIKSGLGYWMGLGMGDIDKDGDQDLYLSNIGSSIPMDIVRGDLKDNQALELEWLILRNDGKGNLSDVTADYELDGYGFAWGGVFEDLNLNGDLDLLVAQNYIKWPGHNVNKLSNKAFLQLSQNGRKGFYHLDQLGLNNPYYGQSALIVDINNDAKPDVIWLNMNGLARAFINKSSNNAIKVAVPDNTAYLGANIVLETQKGKSYTKQIAANIGMASDQTPNVFFGLGQNDNVKAVYVQKADGARQVIRNPDANSTITLQ